jgi:hypothetical protein
LNLSKEKTIQFIKKTNKNKIVGLSTHNETEILEANGFSLDYIGLGAYRDTSTKDVSNVLGKRCSYLAKISRHPVGLIGGVKLEDRVANISFIKLLCIIIKLIRITNSNYHIYQKLKLIITDLYYKRFIFNCVKKLL